MTLEQARQLEVGTLLRITRGSRATSIAVVAEPITTSGRVVVRTRRPHRTRWSGKIWIHPAQIVDTISPRDAAALL